MSKPVESKALHYLYFPDEVTAKTAVEEIKQVGLEVESRISADGTNWLVLVQHKWPLVPIEFDEIQKTLKRITSTYSGEYDGWEIPT